MHTLEKCEISQTYSGQNTRKLSQKNKRVRFFVFHRIKSSSVCSGCSIPSGRARASCTHSPVVDRWPFTRHSTDA